MIFTLLGYFVICLEHVIKRQFHNIITACHDWKRIEPLCPITYMLHDLFLKKVSPANSQCIISHTESRRWTVFNWWTYNNINCGHCKQRSRSHLPYYEGFTRYKVIHRYTLTHCYQSIPNRYDRNRYIPLSRSSVTISTWVTQIGRASRTFHHGWSSVLWVVDVVQIMPSTAWLAWLAGMSFNVVLWVALPSKAQFMAAAELIEKYNNVPYI